MKWKIACIQMDIAFGQPDINYQHAEQWVEKAVNAAADIVILPELWTTGYDLTRLNEIGDVEAEKTIGFIKNMARKHQIHIVGGSIAKKTHKGIYNTMIIIDKNGNLVKEYDKLHLFQLMDEHHFLQPGENDGLFTLDDKICAGFICYDIRFPEWQRAHSARGAEVLFVTAEWPKPRLDHWRSLLISRAIENQAYVVAVNRSGSDVNNVFAGHSMIIDPWGRIVSEAGEESELLTGTLDFTEVSSARSKIPVFEDRRPDYY
ncbi:hydrolase [Peribacillus muralis]|uniref:Hydrolase n=1 Tax=Peribacillus muralis TaxID=264697 RepID=A0A1B3XQ17_9BACI|nr:carbon-nitrogen family hydrolase [Peribacillus muralis]AOH55302.1 hydrolase [Peribacillus muralis]